MVKLWRHSVLPDEYLMILIYLHHCNNRHFFMRVVASGQVFHEYNCDVMCVTLSMKPWLRFCHLCLPLSISSVRALFRFFPHVVHVKVRDGLALVLHGCWRVFECVCVCCSVNVCVWGSSPTHYRFGRWETFFMATSCWEKDFLWLQDIVSLKYDFYYWREASREQRVGVFIPVIGVWVSEGIICPESITKEGSC